LLVLQRVKTSSWQSTAPVARYQQPHRPQHSPPKEATQTQQQQYQPCSWQTGKLHIPDSSLVLHQSSSCLLYSPIQRHIFLQLPVDPMEPSSNPIASSNPSSTLQQHLTASSNPRAPGSRCSCWPGSMPRQ
jgi:hypothetical protein